MCINAQGVMGADDDGSDTSSTEAEEYRHPFFDQYDQVSAFLLLLLISCVSASVYEEKILL